MFSRPPGGDVGHRVQGLSNSWPLVLPQHELLQILTNPKQNHIASPSSGMILSPTADTRNLRRVNVQSAFLTEEQRIHSRHDQSQTCEMNFFGLLPCIFIGSLCASKLPAFRAYVPATSLNLELKVHSGVVRKRTSLSSTRFTAFAITETLVGMLR